MTPLRIVAPEAYARLVLPQTAALWAGKRDLKAYITDNLEIARSRFGRRHYRTIGFFEGRALVSSFKQYERMLQHDGRRLRGFGIGAVFTPTALRGRGYATAMLASALDVARGNGYDVAYLFSDVGPHFYGSIGFVQIPSREIALRADSLPNKRLTLRVLTESNWTGVARCFDICAGGRTIFERTPLIWQWIRLLMRQRSEHPSGQQTNLFVRHGRGVGAYVLGVRIPARDAYVVDEYGFADPEAAQTVPALLRAAAGDLRRIAGWLPPSGAREMIPKGSVRQRRNAILMVAPLSLDGARFASSLMRKANADYCWPTDHI
jgi:GNAT superfamily N-acetyltransferase